MMETIDQYNHLHKPGDKVAVFSDPITRRDFEGIATITRLAPNDNYYLVRFDNEPSVQYPRFIY